MLCRSIAQHGVPPRRPQGVRRVLWADLNCSEARRLLLAPPMPRLEGYRPHRPDVRLGSDSVLRRCLLNVWITAASGSPHFITSSLKSATSRLIHRSKPRLHSITLSARASNIGEMSRPSTLAALRLMTRSNLVGCSTGSSLGFAPLRILST